MKHNLKNFPKTKDYIQQTVDKHGKLGTPEFRALSFNSAINEWRDGFEEELRQLRMQSNFVKIDAILGDS